MSNSAVPLAAKSEQGDLTKDVFVDQIKYQPQSCGKCRDRGNVGEKPPLPLPRSVRQHTSTLAPLVRSFKEAEKPRERVSNAQKWKIK